MEVSSGSRIHIKMEFKRRRAAGLEPAQDINMQGSTNSLAILEDKILKAYNEVSDLKAKFSKILEYQQLLKDRMIT
jgi:hypothetical protein